VSNPFPSALEKARVNEFDVAAYSTSGATLTKAAIKPAI